jgi:hypothetical protein
VRVSRRSTTFVLEVHSQLPKMCPRPSSDQVCVSENFALISDISSRSNGHKSAFQGGHADSTPSPARTGLVPCIASFVLGSSQKIDTMTLTKGVTVRTRTSRPRFRVARHRVEQTKSRRKCWRCRYETDQIPPVWPQQIDCRPGRQTPPYPPSRNELQRHSNFCVNSRASYASTSRSAQVDLRYI